MFYSTLLLAATTLCGVVSAQNNTAFPINGPYTIDPNSVPIVNRTFWCNAQRGNCPLVCGGQAFPNNCSTTDLSYTCTCTDGSKPNISSFTNMIPSYECLQWVNQCVAAAGNDLNQLTACRSVVCGKRNPADVKQNTNNGPASSSSAGPSSSATGNSGGGSPTQSSGSAATSTGAAVAMNVAKNYGTGILAGGMLALFGLAL